MSEWREPHWRGQDVVELGQSLEAITFDFGNTLVPFPASTMADVLKLTAARVADPLGVSAADFMAVWGEERLRQFAEDVPDGREADMAVRAARVLARLRGKAAPAERDRWDDAAAAGLSLPAEVETILDTYAGVFVEVTPVPPAIGPMLERLSGSYQLGVVSNWPLAMAVERYLESSGWARHLGAIVISQRVGAIKPWPAIFEEAARRLGVASGPRLLHVGDDLGADIVGAHELGWRAAWVKMKPEDSPLPIAELSALASMAAPDAILETVLDLESALGLAGRRRSGREARGLGATGAS